jgi:CheY-like chemotaxis protein
VGFDLPDAATVRPPTRVGPMQVAAAKVLVVDDNATNRRILDEVLTNWGARPTLASGGVEALDELERAAAAGEHFPLAIVDCMMPEIDGFTLAAQIAARPQIAGTKLIMLSSAMESNDRARARELGFSAYLLKPLRQSELLETLTRSLGDPLCLIESPVHAPAVSIPAHARRLRILLAEDSIVNQCLALRWLEKWGHSVIIANNGRDALRVASEQQIDLVLMDVQMPEMSGMEATAWIREREQGTTHHLPIIAMTAHAMKGDRELCLAAGMDDYISKPIRAEELHRAIAALIGELPVAESPDPLTAVEAPTAERPAGGLDKSDVLARFNGDAGLLREIVDVFLDVSPTLLAELRAAASRRDLVVFKRTAHTMKGSLGYFGESPALEGARSLETRQEPVDWAAVEADCTALDEAIQRLKPELMALAAETAADSAAS